MQLIIEYVQPYVSTIVLAIVGLIATVFLGAINMLKAKAGAYFDAKLTAAQRELLHRIAEEAYAFAETVFKDVGGPAKLEKALQYAIEQLAKSRVSVSAVELQAAIEKAWIELERINKK
jgi:hypothetical protein